MGYSDDMQTRTTSQKPHQGKNLHPHRWHRGKQSVSRGRRWGKSYRHYDGTSGVPEFKNGAITGAFSRLFNDLQHNNELNTALDELRQTSEFRGLEAAAERRLGKPVEYKLIRGLTVDADGTRAFNLPWADTDAGIVYIPRGFSSNATFPSGIDRVRFSLQRVIFHETYHQAYTYGIELSHFSQTISPTNNFMSKYYGQGVRTEDSLCIRSNCSGPFISGSTR